MSHGLGRCLYLQLYMVGRRKIFTWYEFFKDSWEAHWDPWDGISQQHAQNGDEVLGFPPRSGPDYEEKGVAQEEGRRSSNASDDVHQHTLWDMSCKFNAVQNWNVRWALSIGSGTVLRMCLLKFIIQCEQMVWENPLGKWSQIMQRWGRSDWEGQDSA